ncbi:MULTISPECIES: winged helix-turn-helix domain-containing protein [unclassified Salinibacterium]|uniref:winged helix-turn-helix domain-containing protein n=1 Tax=unclassified Salinibacterium TaxID=2632331 RepID=UPI001422F498|nr:MULTISPECIES: winged helix-turn-helix domain-containing protein [unclassified Salinibacterium]
MSLATLDLARPITVAPYAPRVDAAPAPTTSAASAPTATPDAERAAAPRIRAVPEGTEARGFVLYVGLDEAKAAAAGTDLGAIVDALKKLTAALAPDAETHAAIALAPQGSGGRDVDVVRLALQDPAAVAKRRQAAAEPVIEKTRGGVVVDLSRKRVVLDGDAAPLTYKEFELLQYLVLREGRTIERLELIHALWSDGDEGDAPNERTIDVHVRRLRSKLGAYEDIVRTVRGVGYRFDRHADVSIRHSTTPSPDFF